MLKNYYVFFIVSVIVVCFGSLEAKAENIVPNTELAGDTLAGRDGRKQKVFDEEWLHSLRKPDESLMNALLNYYKIPEPIARIFFCLAVSNTHRFKDQDLMGANNLYCLCDENNLGRYYQYHHWSESVGDILGIYKNELGKDFNDVTDLLDCITAHHDREKVKEMSRYHEMYFGKKLHLRSDASVNKRKGGLPW